MRKKVSSKNILSEILPNQSIDLLKEMHLLTQDGNLNADARRKLKQINHFSGFLQPAIEDIFDRYKNPFLVDVGSGNSYLSFIIYDLFFKTKDQGQILSIDSRPELIERGKNRAKIFRFNRMEFLCSNISNSKLPKRVHLLTALHACDLATDEALLLGVKNKMDYIFLVPCCQAEVSKLLQKNENPHACSLLYDDPLHRREFGSHLTNIIRVLALRSFGYKVTVTELTSWEHTAKGELIIAKRVNNYDQKAKEKLETILEHFSLETFLTKAITNF